MNIPLYSRLIDKYYQVLARETEMITKTRIKILAISLLCFIGMFILLISIFAASDQLLLIIRNVSLLVLFISGFFILLNHRDWQIAGHIFITGITVMILSNIIFFVKGTNIITVQLTLLVLSGGYYILGEKWGRIYSLINIIPTLSISIIDYYFDTPGFDRYIYTSSGSFVIVLSLNFILLAFIHYSFFKAFRKAHDTEREMMEDLKRAVLEAQELAMAKTNFLSTMSHELRTPLNAIVGMTNVLLLENPQPEQLNNLKVLKFSVENLMSTVNDILDFNKIDSELIELDAYPFMPIELINNIHGAFDNLANEKDIEFSYLIDPKCNNLVVAGDKVRLTQILFNLVGNAIKFTSRGFVKIKLEVKEVDDTDVYLHFQIEDTGIGIPKDRLSGVFDPFTQVSSTSNRHYHGTGLGLTIAYRLVKLHGSEMKLESAEGVGSIFSFQIKYPIASFPVKVDQAVVNLGNRLSGLKVLVAEDEPINVMVIKKLLEKYGIIPDIAVNGSKALAAVMDNDYDVVLMDINMPVMDGFEASKMIRKLEDKQKANISIIAVTASIDAALKQANSYTFVDDCLLKPFKPDQLKEKLELVATKVGYI